MKELVAILEELDGSNVKTYIQSGNVVFQCAQKAASQLASKLGIEINKRRGFAPHVLLLSLKEIEQAIAANPFPEAESDPTSLHLGFLDAVPTQPDLKKLESLKTKSERFALNDRVFYLHAPDGIGRSKLAANAERALGVAMTDRNWRTICKVRDMASELL
jgi:uncharacterized protein (DUF1697 family)